jgi:hypothetical protein
LSQEASIYTGRSLAYGLSHDDFLATFPSRLRTQC